MKIIVQSVIKMGVKLLPEQILSSSYLQESEIEGIEEECVYRARENMRKER